MAYLHDNIHGWIVWYEDISVAVVFTLWAYDWFAEKIKNHRKKTSVVPHSLSPIDMVIHGVEEEIEKEKEEDGFKGR